ncbi:MAG: insulinase family protein, partial [Actinomycetota bacterium]
MHPESVPVGYEVRHSRPLPRLEGHFYDLVHEGTGARHLHLAVPDRNSAFCVLYRTLPSDSTGAPHIMEHCVSGGSRRFPPGAGADMYTRSLVTDLNASTNADSTLYYFATRHRDDYMNWLEYVVDVSMFPRMERDTFLRQRGRFEFNDPEDPASGLKFVGIIFNEMKAVFASPSRHAYRALSRALFPGHPYSQDAGGDPAEVPKLTYEELLEFNRRFYHPANACFISRGDLPLSEILSSVEGIVGADFPRREPAAFPEVPPLEKPVVAEAPIPVGQDDGETHGQAIVGWLTVPASDSYGGLLLELTKDLLFETASAPLRRALEGSGFVRGSIRTTIAPYRGAMLSVHLDGTDPADAAAAEEVILDRLSSISRDGLDPEAVDTAIARLELRRRDPENPFYALLEAVMPPIVHGGDPYSAVELESDLARLSDERADGRPLEDFIRTNLVENRHRARVGLIPDPGLESRLAETEARWLDEVGASLVDEDRSRIIEDARRLAVNPKGSFTPRGLSAREGLVELAEPSSTTDEVAGVPVDVFDEPTGGITYLNLRIDVAGLREDLLPYLGLLTSAMERKARSSGSSIDRVIVNNHLRLAPDGESCLHWIEMRAAALDRDETQLARVVREVFVVEPAPADLELITRESASALEQGVMANAQVHLRRLAGGTSRLSSRIDDQTRGLTQLRFLKDLAGEPKR